MKFLKLSLFILGALTATAHASQLQLTSIEEGWTPHLVTAGTFEAAFSGNAEAILNFHETSEDTLATIFVHEFPVPANVKLTDDTRVWHKVLFPNKATVKYSVVNERAFQVNGQWRYVIEYQANTGTMLNSIVMVTVAGGKLHVFLFEQSRPLYIKLIASVRLLFKNIEASVSSSAPEKKQNPSPKSQKSDKA